MKGGLKIRSKPWARDWQLSFRTSLIETSALLTINFLLLVILWAESLSELPCATLIRFSAIYIHMFLSVHLI